MSDDPPFELLESIKPPEAFDRALAHLEMRSVTNNLAESMDLSVSASFSDEYVEIPLSDGDVLEVKCTINEAIIVATYFNCSPTERNNLEPTRGYNSEVKIKQSTHTTESTGFNVEGGGTAKGSTGALSGRLSSNAKKNSGKQMEHTSDTVWKANAQQVEYDVDQIRIHSNPNRTPLRGKLVDGQVCWHVKPKKKEIPFGVLAELRVRRGWMPISEPRQRNVKGKIAALLNQVFQLSDHGEEFHRQAFSLLVEHLVQKGLQTKQSGLEAVLAARAVVAMPTQSEDRIQARYSTNMEREVVLPIEDLKTVLSGNRRAVLNTLERHKLDSQALNSLALASENVEVLRAVVSHQDRRRTTIITKNLVYDVTRRFGSNFQENNFHTDGTQKKGMIDNYEDELGLEFIESATELLKFAPEEGGNVDFELLFKKAERFYDLHLTLNSGLENKKRSKTIFLSKGIDGIYICNGNLCMLYLFSLIITIGEIFEDIIEIELAVNDGKINLSFIVSVDKIINDIYRRDKISPKIIDLKIDNLKNNNIIDFLLEKGPWGSLDPSILDKKTLNLFRVLLVLDFEQE